jgi:hypothetical protein
LSSNDGIEQTLAVSRCHADETVTDGYSKLREDVQYRSEVADKIGLGFEFSAQTTDVVPNVPSLGPAVVQQNAA